MSKKFLWLSYFQLESLKRDNMAIFFKCGSHSFPKNTPYRYCNYTYHYLLVLATAMICFPLPLPFVFFGETVGFLSAIFYSHIELKYSFLFLCSATLLNPKSHSKASTPKMNPSFSIPQLPNPNQEILLQDDTLHTTFLTPMYSFLLVLISTLDAHSNFSNYPFFA